MPLVTALFVPTTTGGGALVIQIAGGTRFVVDSKVKPVALVGHVKITLVPEGMIVSLGGDALAAPSERLNTVPSPLVPPLNAVPYRVLPDKIKPEAGKYPSELVLTSVVVLRSGSLKLCRVVKPVPLVVTANTVP